MITEEFMTKLLQDTEQAHARFEKKLGRRDEDWSSWYSHYIVEELRRTGRCV